MPHGESAPGDSAGVPWAGRRFDPGRSSADDGSAPPVLLAALTGAAHGGSAVAVIDALRDTRLLVPLLAERGDQGVGPHGRTVDKTQELSIVTVTSPDGRTVLPAFSSVATMAGWNPAARPIPVEARRVALAAGAEGTEQLVVDPGSPTEFVAGRSALRALATGEPWRPPDEDPVVVDAVRTAVAGEPEVLGVDLEPVRSGHADSALRIVLTLVPGLDQLALDVLLRRLGERWAVDTALRERVDSLGIRVR